MDVGEGLDTASYRILRTTEYFVLQFDRAYACSLGRLRALLFYVCVQYIQRSTLLS